MKDALPDPAGRGKAVRSEALSTEIYTSFDELASVRNEWDEFIERSGSDIYFTFDWLETWWKYYGRNRVLRCFLIRKAGQPVAALPFLIERLGLGPFSVRLAKFVGADFAITVFSPAIEPDHHTKVLRAVWEDLFTKQDCDAMSFSPLSGASPLVDAVRDFCAHDPDYGLARDDSVSPHTIFRLPENFDCYLMALKSQPRSNYRRDIKRLSANYQLAHRVVAGPQAVGKFDEFADMHNAQWATAGRLGHFGDWPKSNAFNRELVEKLAAKGQARFYELVCDGKTVSMEYCFVLGDRCYWRLPARNPAEELNKLGLGRVGLVKMVEALIDHGVRIIEAGPGHYGYKVKHLGEELLLRRLVITGLSVNSRVRVKSFLHMADLLNFIYYRIWFLKVAPRICKSQSPLWRSWIQTRL